MSKESIEHISEHAIKIVEKVGFGDPLYYLDGGIFISAQTKKKYYVEIKIKEVKE